MSADAALSKKDPSWYHLPNAMKRLLERPGLVSVLSAVLACGSSVLIAEDVRLAWNPSADSRLAGYKLYIGETSHQYTRVADVGISASYTAVGLGAGMHYFAVTAYDSMGKESGYSNEVSAAIDVNDGSSPPTVRTTGNAATISWITARPSNLIFEYGTNTRYGKSVVMTATRTAEHLIALDGLVRGTTYHYRIRAVDSQGNLIISSDRTFTTAAVPDGPPVATLAFPHSDTGPSAGLYTGIALVNLDTMPALLTFKALDASGIPIATKSDSSAPLRILYPGEQVAVLDSQLFGDTSPGGSTPDWIQVGSSAPYVAGFFITFDANLTSITGTTLSNSTTKGLIFPEAVPQASTRVMLRNPGAAAATITVDLVAPEGSTLGSVSRKIEPGASLRTAVAGLFPGPSAQNYSYLRIISDQPLYGYEYLENTSRWISVLTRPPASGGTKTLYAAQYVYGGPWASEIGVINSDSTQDTLTQRWMGDDGTQIGATCTSALPGSGKVQLTDPSCFAVSPQQAQQGYVEIKSGQSGIMGNILLRETAGRMPGTSLPLLSELRTSYVIPHVASDEMYFTGIAILNPGESKATVTTRVLSSSGETVASLSESLPSRNRKSRVLTEMFPGLIGKKLLSGYIRITSDKPLAVFALFGTNDLNTLLALPAQPAP